MAEGGGHQPGFAEWQQAMLRQQQTVDRATEAMQNANAAGKKPNQFYEYVPPHQSYKR